MGSYLRILATKNRKIPLSAINDAFGKKGIPLSVSMDGPKTKDWTELNFAHTDGTPICSIEKNSAAPGELGADEIEEFVDELDHAQPQNAAKWLRHYFRKVCVVYAIEIHHRGASRSFGWDVIDSMRDLILSIAGGIIQSDFEGFSNEEGYQILWQFSKNAKGDWGMAVLGEQGEWIRFRMELSNRKQREAFLRGEVPKGVKIVG